VDDEAGFELLAYECAFLVQNGWRCLGRGLWWHPRADEPVSRDRAVGLQRTWLKDEERTAKAVERHISGQHKAVNKDSIPEDSLIGRIRQKRRDRDRPSSKPPPPKKDPRRD
jgi:hypothetical protein